MQRVVPDSKDVAIESPEDDFPPVLCCSILFTPLKDFVIGDDGRFYEREAIEKRLKDNDKSPFTNKKLLFIDNKVLVEQIKDIVQAWKENNKTWQDKVKKLEKDNKALNRLKKENEQLINQLAEYQAKKHTNKLKLESKTNSSTFFPPLTQSRNNFMLLKSINERCSINLVKSYIQDGANKDCINNDTGDTALITAIKMREKHPDKYQKMIVFLCNHLKVDINKKNFKGQTAMNIAIEKNDEWVRNFLLEKLKPEICVEEHHRLRL